MGLWSKAKGLFSRVKDKFIKPLTGFVSKIAAPVGAALEAAIPGAGAIGQAVGSVAGKFREVI